MKIRASDLPLLLSLNALLEEENVTRAASRMAISQPAMSGQLARLRDLFGDPLLVPSETGRGMVSTARGQALKEPLREALRTLQSVVEGPREFDPARDERTFTLAANDNAAAMLGIQLIGRLKAGRRLRLALRNVTPSAIAVLLERGEVDVLLASEAAIPQGFRSERILDEHFEMAQRKGHPRGLEAPTAAAYAALNHVIVSGTGGFRSPIDDVLERLGLARLVTVSVAYYGLVPAILEATDLVATLPSRFLRRFEASLDRFALPLDLRPFSLSMAWHARFDDDPAHLWLRQQLALSADATGTGAP
ncbi:LysR family transcriptional regulator [Telmatospirillum sp.]|uniref:LysR family transcriptional regulator n=1 Tax=Telmatospirillum sp. TaxID=2079197 RepID=UPI00284D0B20|nr:LysR family transcriptional regulator [Telmatospirillum sp.]MDR3440330.1 LysR family transcriptional regulator [Telmatospirillum sp.]